MRQVALRFNGIDFSAPSFKGVKLEELRPVLLEALTASPSYTANPHIQSFIETLTGANAVTPV